MRVLLTLVAAACIVGCNLYSPVEIVPPLCDSSAVLTVGPGTQPEITWTGECRVTWVRVDTLPWGNSAYVPVAWQMYSTTASIRSPVRVGIDRTSVHTSPVVLGRGQLYQACLANVRDRSTGVPRDLCVSFTP